MNVSIRRLIQKRCFQTLVDQKPVPPPPPPPPSLALSLSSPVFDKYDHSIPYWVRLVLMRQLNAVEEQRKTRELSKESTLAAEGSKYICRVCHKPNTLDMTLCTACGFNLSKWDLSKPHVVDDLFGKIVRGELDTHKIYHQDSEVVVFGDGFPISDCHLLSIPVTPLPDATVLTTAHLPLLQHLYSSALQVIRKMEIPHLKGKEVEDCIIAGFNVPVSVPHLHLHVVVPPLYQLNAFRHPRFHFYPKVLKDLQQHGRLITYHESPNEEEGSSFYTKHVLHNHSSLLHDLRASMHDKQ